MKRYRAALIGTLSAVLVVVGLAISPDRFSQSHRFSDLFRSPGLPVLDYTGPPIALDHLATEATDPYLSSGLPPMRAEDIAAAQHFPDVRSCLVKSEQDAAIPDLRQIDWARMRTREQASVCLFRIFSSLETPERALLWFAAQGLRTEGPTPGSFNRAPIVTVHGYNSPQRDRRVYVGSSLFDDWFIMLTCYVSSFSAFWDEGGRLRGTGYVKNFL